MGPKRASLIYSRRELKAFKDIKDLEECGFSGELLARFIKHNTLSAVVGGDE